MRFNDLDERKQRERQLLEKVLAEHKDLRLQDEKYIIRAFRDFAEFEKEGSELRHAIAYYALGKYAHGDDYLFAMRRADDPETPFISLEFDTEGQFVMAKKLNNFNAEEPDELAFIERFRREVLFRIIVKDLPKGLYLRDTALYVNSYRRLAGLKGTQSNTVKDLKRQLSEVGAAKGIRWCSITDPVYLREKTDQLVCFTVVYDSKEAIYAELPPDGFKYSRFIKVE